MSQQLKSEFDAVAAQLHSAGAPFELAGDDEQGFYYVNAPENLAQALDAAREYGDKEFLVYEGERFSFNDVYAQADAIATALQAQGVQPGDRVAIAMRNYPEWMTAFIGTVTMGAVVVPMNSWGTPADVAYTVTDAGAALVFCDQQRFDGLTQELGDAVPLVLARPASGDHPASLQHFIAPYLGKTPERPSIKSDDLALMMYTSGTSGKPKGAISTHRAVCQAIYNMEFFAAAAAMTNGDRITAMLERGFEPTTLLAVPLFHVSGCYAQFLLNLRGGRRIVIMYKWDVARALEYIEQERVTSMPVAPSMALDLLDNEAFDAADTSSLSAMGIGGSATPPKVVKLLEEKVPNNFSGTGWGMTETNAQGASLTGNAFAEKLGSSGFPHPIVKLKVVDEEGNEQPSGATGELWIQSCTNIREYWNRPEANAKDFRDGWLCTGDIAYLDEDGFLFLADRAKDMIIRGGENIYPAEIEGCLVEHPSIAEVAAIGLPDERMGEQVAVVVVPREGENLTPESVVAYSREHLAAFKVPSRVVMWAESLPRNATNKVLKGPLKDAVMTQLGL